MSTPSMHRPQVSLSPRAFTRLSYTLSVSNARYRAVAASARAVANTTHHARRRARSLGLVVDTASAVDCPEHLVAVVPLPVLDRSVAPTHRRRPALRLDIPRDAPSNCNDSRSTCSAQDAAPAAPTAAPSALRGKLSGNVYKDPSYLVPSRRAPEPPVVILDVESDDDVFDGLELGYPASAAADHISSSSSLPTSSASSRSRSSSNSGSDSSGPHTPADVEVVVVSGLVSPLKRKCIVMDPDDEPVEKRPKYARKDWVRNPRKLCELGAARSEATRHISHRVARSS